MDHRYEPIFQWRVFNRNSLIRYHESEERGKRKMHVLISAVYSPRAAATRSAITLWSSLGTTGRQARATQFRWWKQMLQRSSSYGSPSTAMVEWFS